MNIGIVNRELGLCADAKRYHRERLEKFRHLDDQAGIANSMYALGHDCLELGEYLEQNTTVKAVRYPGLRSSSGYELARKYFNGVPGTIMTIDLDSQEACYSFMNKLKIIKRATNLNDNKSLIIHPYSTIYAEFSEEEREQAGIRDTMMRLSVGIENAADLVEDIRQALS